MSGRKSRSKGGVGEREVVNLIKGFGIPAKRISMLETAGIDKGDIIFAKNWKGSVKYGDHVPEFIYKSRRDEEFLFMRKVTIKKRGYQWLVLMDAEFFLENFIKPAV